MSRIAAIDFGTKRVGIALSDPLGIIANGVGWFTPEESLAWLKEQHHDNDLTDLVIGKPKRLHGVDSDVETVILQFIRIIEREVKGLKIHRIDERFTSKMAMQSMNTLKTSKKKRKEKGLIDQISATIILQEFLNMK